VTRRTWIPLGLVALLAACRSSRNAAEIGPPVQVYAAMQGDERVHHDLELCAPRVLREPGARAAEFELRNRASRAIDFLYCVEWYDARNARIETLPQLWYPVHLAGGATTHVRAAAPTAQAESFRLLAQRPGAFRR
jgi:uncharacterized protein YcfL